MWFSPTRPGFESRLGNSRLAQLVERKTLNLVVVGSSPTVGVNFYFYARKLFFIFRKGAPVLQLQAPVAQLAARRSHNPKVASSILAGSSFPDSLVGQDRWLSPTRPGFDSRSGKVFVL